jgi:N-acetylglucosamine malate deacetylase 2
MKYLYIFPHPDDESFGPAAGMHQQLGQGHEVHLLTLTKGGATQQRNRLGLSIEEMGEVRYQEMLAVQQTLGLSSMTVLDLPDSGLKRMDPREIEAVVRYQIERLRPDIIVSYPVHGISGFHDHLVMHAVIKRLYLQMRDEGADYLKRLAFFTVPDGGGPAIESTGFRFKQSQPEEIACMLKLEKTDLDAMKRALACYDTYQETIEQSGVVDLIGDRLHFELWGESHENVLNDLAEALPKES